MQAFKVLCIDAEPRPGDYPGPLLEFMKEYTAVNEFLGQDRAGVWVNCYKLSELSHDDYGRSIGYHTDRFSASAPTPLFTPKSSSMQILSFDYNRSTEELTILYNNGRTRFLCIKGIELYELLRREGYATDYDYKAGRLLQTYSYNVSDPRGIHGVVVEEKEYSLPIEDFMGAELYGASGIKLVRDLVKRYHSDQRKSNLRLINRIRKIFRSLTTNPII
jgi:hypothetical protein